jgi:hypothetical protein
MAAHASAADGQQEGGITAPRANKQLTANKRAAKRFVRRCEHHGIRAYRLRSGLCSRADEHEHR